MPDDSWRTDIQPRLSSPVQGRIVSSTQDIENQCAAKVGQVHEEVRQYELRRQEQILIERNLLSQTLDSLRVQMAAEVGSIQAQAQERA